MCYPQFEGRLPTRYSPVRHFTPPASRGFSFDLHVLSTPPAFILSQDQTLQLNSLEHNYKKGTTKRAHYLVFKDQTRKTSLLKVAVFVKNFFYRSNEKRHLYINR
jgi:hypothetical protein